MALTSEKIKEYIIFQTNRNTNSAKYVHPPKKYISTPTNIHPHKKYKYNKKGHTSIPFFKKIK